MRTIAFINWKGGVGKTTCSTNAAYLFGEKYGVKTLFIDLDKQGNASSWFGADPDKGTIANILCQGTDAVQVMAINPMSAEEVIQKTRYKNIDLIAANSDLLTVNLALLTNRQGRQDNILFNALKGVAENYDICIIDNPPDSNISVLNGIVLADDIIAVTLPNKYSVDGVKQLERELSNYNQLLNISAKVKGVIINQFTSTADTYEIMDELKDKYKLFPTIRAGRMTRKRLNECINHQKSIYELSSNSAFAKDLKRVIESVIKEG
ncbi:MAG: ParA family protein [Selenomonadaceae bacterium]|nr:ParA family protein [Selenomonadaceae bacterium]